MKLKTKTVGVLMLDTNFPRLRGDIGNPVGFSFPLIYGKVSGASPTRVVREQSAELLSPFIQAAHELVSQGAEILTTSCGFLIYFQDQLRSAAGVPVYTSALLQLPELERKFGLGNVGVLTISKSSLSPPLLSAAGVSPDIPVGSTENGREFTQAILENRHDLDVTKCRSDLVDAATDLMAEHPHLKAVVLECTNMAPHADAISEAAGVPVYSLNTYLESVMQCGEGISADTL